MHELQFMFNWRSVEPWKTFTCWHASRDLRSANLRALLCGWLPWLCGPRRPSSAAPERFETNCSVWSRRTASDCRRALVGRLVWFSPSGCNLCARWRPDGNHRIGLWLWQFKTFFLPFCSFWDRRFHSPRLSHQTRWIDDCREFHTTSIDCLYPLHPMATALFLNGALLSLSLPALPFVFRFNSFSI